MLLEGKTILVTGVGPGLGSECAASALKLGATHTVDPSAKAHCPKASHAPVVPQPIIPCGTHVRDGSIVPAPTCVHVPSAPATAQLWHCGHDAEPQQTPSTQLPLVHSSPTPQVLPVSFSTLAKPARTWSASSAGWVWALE